MASFWARARVCLFLVLVAATVPVAAQVPDWVVSEDGQYVLHRPSQLVWTRCVEGMEWKGKACVGTPELLSHAAARARATERARTSGDAWRLPRLKELQLLAHDNARAASGGGHFMPMRSQEWCWSATAIVDTTRVNEYNYANVARGINGQSANQLKFLHGWAVDVATGEARNNVLKRHTLAVRLVRSLD